MRFKAEMREEFERQAEWRSGKADEHPDDARNRGAVALHLRLAETVEACPDEVIVAAWELIEDAADAKDWLDMMCSVGFHYWPASAEAFCRDFIAKRTGGRKPS